MNYLIWRLHRNQLFFAAGAIAALSVLLLVTGIKMANDYHAFLSTCSASQSCSDSGQLFSGDGAILDLVDLTIVVPLLFGLFWGAPLISKEFEDGTHNLAWTQGVTRSRWLKANMFWAFLAAAAWGGVIAALVSWWRFPENALDGRFSAFDIQGIAPVVFSLFAVGLGIMVGSLIRRVQLAIATTLGVFVAVRVAIGSTCARTISLLSRRSFLSAVWKSASGFMGHLNRHHRTGRPALRDGVLTDGLPRCLPTSHLGDKALSLGCLASTGSNN